MSSIYRSIESPIASSRVDGAIVLLLLLVAFWAHYRRFDSALFACLESDKQLSALFAKDREKEGEGEGERKKRKETA